MPKRRRRCRPEHCGPSVCFHCRGRFPKTDQAIAESRPAKGFLGTCLQGSFPHRPGPFQKSDTHEAFRKAAQENGLCCRIIFRGPVVSGLGAVGIPPGETGIAKRTPVSGRIRFPFRQLPEQGCGLGGHSRREIGLSQGLEDADIFRLRRRGPLADRDQRFPVVPLPVQSDELVIGKAGEESASKFPAEQLFETGNGLALFPAVMKRPGQREEMGILLRTVLDQLAIDGNRLGRTPCFHQVVSAF